MSDFLRNVRYAVRTFAANPVTTTICLVSLALGIGANSAIFSLINAIILRSLDVHSPEQLVSIYTVNGGSVAARGPLSLAMFEEIRKRQQVFSHLFAFSAGAISNIQANGTKYAGSVNGVTSEYFAALGVRPLMGRLITEQDFPFDSALPARVAVLDYRCWQRHYGGDATAIGKTVVVDGTPFTIIGITPERFKGLMIEAAVDVTVPVGWSLPEIFHERKHAWLDVVGRLKAGVSLRQAGAQLRVLWPAVQKAAMPEDYESDQQAEFLGARIELASARSGISPMRERLRSPLAVLMSIVAAVLLLACANLANLMLARAAARKYEIGVRIAFGAGRWSLLHQLLTESVMLSLAGAVLGLQLAKWTSRWLAHTVWTGYVPLTLDPAPDARVLAFSFSIAILTGVIFGLAPVRDVMRTDPIGALQTNDRGAYRRPGIFPKLLVTGQVALSFALVTGAALFVETLHNLRSADLGFRREGVLVLQLFPITGRERIVNRAAYYHRLSEQVSRIPGIQAVSYSQVGPIVRYQAEDFVASPLSHAAPVRAVEDWVGPGFFRLIGMHLIAGREFDWRDDEQSRRVVILSENLAQRLFPDESPLGRRIIADTSPDHQGIEVVGVVNPAVLWNIRSPAPMAIYMPLLQDPGRNQPMLDVRTTGNPTALLPRIRQSLEAASNHYALRIQTLEQRADQLLLQERVVSMLSSSLGALSILLASIGLYGLISNVVAGRTAEIGIRMAVGAQPPDVLKLILRDVLLLVLTGIVGGAIMLGAASRLASGMLFGLLPMDPKNLLLSGFILAATGLFAGYVPARRTARIDPIRTLRGEY